MLDIHVLNAIAFTIAVDGDDFRFTDVNAEAEQVSGLRREEQIGKRPQDCFPPSLAERLLCHYRACAANGRPLVYEMEYVLPNGYFCWRTTLVPIMGLAQTSGLMLGICVDVTADKIAERATHAFHEKMSLAIGAIEGGFWLYDVATDCFEVSRPLAELIGGPGRTTLDLAEYTSHVHVEDPQGGLVTPNDDHFTVEYRVVAYDGRIRWLKSKRRQIRDETGAVIRVVALVLDITDQKQALRTLESEAATDGLTHLKNRRAFDRIASQSWQAACATGQNLGLVLIDLDGFKPINDRHGHRAGDEILRLVARRIERLVRSRDVLARIGGDEFAVLIRDNPAETIDVLVKRLERAFAKPFRLGNLAVGIGASLGTAMRQEDDADFDAVVERADRALYAGKNERRAICA